MTATWITRFSSVCFAYNSCQFSYLLYRAHNNVVLYLQDLLLFFFFIDKFLLINWTLVLTFLERSFLRYHIFHTTRYSISYMTLWRDDFFSLVLLHECTVSQTPVYHRCVHKYLNMPSPVHMLTSGVKIVFLYLYRNRMKKWMLYVYRLFNFYQASARVCVFPV